MKIWKFPLSLIEAQTVSMPQDAKLLTLQMQNGIPCLWALCDEKAPLFRRHIAIYGTGNPIPDDPGDYIATFQMDGGALVFHVFEIRKKD